jgi:hypothetical protein
MTIVRMWIAAAALAAAGIGTALALPASASAWPASQTISFTEHNVSDRSFNLGSGNGFAIGYVELVANTLVRGGKQIGHDGESYTVTRLGSGSADEVVSATDVLAYGQIDLAGLVTSTPHGPGTFHLAVTGGTGRYTGARGYATVAPGSAPKVTIHITS